MSRCKLVTVVILLSGSTVVFGVPGLVDAADQGTLDPSFGSGGKVVIPFDLVAGGIDSAVAVAVQPDGRMVVVGAAEKLGLDLDFAMLRLKRNGDLDLTFGAGGKVVIPFDLGGSLNDTARAVAIQSDGAIVVAGSVDGADGDVDFGIVRVDEDGGLDPTFGVGGKTTVAFDLGGAKHDHPRDIAIQSDGKILVAGQVDGSLGNDDFGVLRLTAGGLPDVGFGLNGLRVIFFDIGGSKDEEVYGLALQPTGEILLAGPVSVGWGVVDMGVVRLLSNSVNDSSFGTGGKVRVQFDLVGPARDVASDVALQDDGKILVAGAAETAGGDSDFAIARLETTGNLDGTFAGDGKATVAFDLGGSERDYGYGVALEADGRIVVAGYVDGPGGDRDFGAARFGVDGTLDSTFGSSGIMTVPFDLGGGEDFLQDLAIPPTGGIFLVGGVDVAVGGRDFAVAKVNGVTVFGDGFETGETGVWSFTIP